MANNKKQKNEGTLEETKGGMIVIGKLKGVLKDNFYKETTTKAGKPARYLNFGVEYENGKTLYINASGFTKQKVYFSVGDGAGGFLAPIAIDWDKRATYKAKDTKAMGIEIGIEKTVNENGKTETIVKNFVEFDAVEYLSQQLVELGDNTMIEVYGKIEPQEYMKGGDLVKSTKFVLKRIYLFDGNTEKMSEKDKKATHCFHQNLIVNEVKKVKNAIVDEDGTVKEPATFNILGQVVGYKSITNTTLTMTDSKLAKTLRDVLINTKDTFKVEVHGLINVIKNEETTNEEVDDNDGWGSEDVSAKTTKNTKTELFVEGAKKETLDKEHYTKALVEKYISSLNKDKVVEDNFSDKDNTTLVESSDDDEWDSEWGDTDLTF